MSVSPAPRMSFSASLACSEPTMPGSTPRTPPSAQLGRELGRRRGGVEAAVAGACERVEDRDLALEAVDRAVHDGDAVPDGGVVDEVARGEVVCAVDDHVPAVGEDPLDVLGREPLLVGDHGHVGIERLDRAFADCTFGCRACPSSARSGAAGSSRRRRRRRRCRASLRRRLRDRATREIRARRRRSGARGTRAASADPPRRPRGSGGGGNSGRAARRTATSRVVNGEAVALPVGEAAGHRDDVVVPELTERLGGKGRAEPPAQ